MEGRRKSMKQQNRGSDRRFAYLWLCALTCTGCVSKIHVKDIAFVAVTPVLSKEGISDTDIPPPVPGHANVLRVRFRTSEKLSDVYRRSDAGGAYVQITLCPFDKTNFVGFSAIQYRGYAVQSGSLRVGSEGQPPYEYEGYFRYESQWRFDVAAHSEVAFPLPPKPQDLCFQLQGPGFMYSGGFDSNIAVIPKEAMMRVSEGSAEANAASIPLSR
jgi:hypothetical protein